MHSCNQGNLLEEVPCTCRQGDLYILLQYKPHEHLNQLLLNPESFHCMHYLLWLLIGFLMNHRSEQWLSLSMVHQDVYEIAVSIK